MNKIVIVFILIFILVLKYYKLFLYKKIEKETFSDNEKIVIYRTSKSNIVNQKLYNNCYKKWFSLNKNITMLWFDDKDADNYMKNLDKNIYITYKRLLPGAFKADLFRLCILYEKGGLYVDCETLPYVSLNEMLKNCINKHSKHFFVSILDNVESGSGIHNGFIYCSPKHPFIKENIRLIISNVSKKRYTSSELGITGPLCLKKAIKNVLNVKGNNFKEGLNKYGELSFYLYKLVFGPFQYVYKKNKIIMSKKHCFLSYIKNKLKSSYVTDWNNRKVYNLELY
jgi:mannosyltransferase OCH1-like enzyme